MTIYGDAKGRPDGDWKACPHCGTCGFTIHTARWLGTVPEREQRMCQHCDGRGWLPAPPWYKLPVRQWPAGEVL